MTAAIVLAFLCVIAGLSLGLLVRRRQLAQARAEALHWERFGCTALRLRALERRTREEIEQEAWSAVAAETARRPAQ